MHRSSWGLISDFPGEKQAHAGHILFGKLEGKHLGVVVVAAVTQRGVSAL